MTPKKVFLGMLVILAVMIAGGGLGFYLVDQTLATRAYTIRDLATDAEILDLKITSSKQAAQDLAENADVANIIEEVLPPKKIQSNIIGELLEIARNNNVIIDGISFPASDPTAADFNITQTTPLEGVSGVRFTAADIGFKTSFSNSLGMLDDFKDNRRKMQISKISMSPILDENGRETDVFSVRITIEIFVRSV